MLGFLLDFINEFAEFLMPTVFSKSFVKAHLCSHFLAEKEWKVKQFSRSTESSPFGAVLRFRGKLFPTAGGRGGGGGLDLVFHIKGCSQCCTLPVGNRMPGSLDSLHLSKENCLFASIRYKL